MMVDSGPSPADVKAFTVNVHVFPGRPLNLCI